jgi:type IV secretion system protein VirB2
MTTSSSTQETALCTTSGADRVERLLSVSCNVALLALICLPQLAHAQTSGSAIFGGLTPFLKDLVNLLVYEWGYYIGIITLAIQGYRWKAGRIDLMGLGGWAFGIALVFFAPNLVGTLRSSAGGSI